MNGQTSTVPTRRAARGAGVHWIALAALVAVSACSDDDDSEGTEQGSATDADSPLYAMLTQVYSTDDRTVYVRLSNTLDLVDPSLDGAKEFGGVANFAAVGGRILVSKGEEPTITEYAITPEREWAEGESVSFSDYPLEDNANFYYQYLLDEHTAYMPFDVSKRVVWDPTDMSITSVMEDSNLPLEKDGLRLDTGGNRNSVAYEEQVLQPFFYHDEDWLHHGDQSLVAVYDPETHRETEIISLPCPGLSLATQDEDGNTYFGTWGYLPTLALYGEGAAPCVARVTPDRTLDEAFTTDFTDWTDGRYVNNFRYIGKGKAIGNVLHHEELDADFSAPYDADIDEAIGKSGPHWRLWMFDLEAAEAWPIEGIDVEVASGAQFAVLDGRTFIFAPFDDWASTRVYELDAEGVATKRFDTIGDIFKWIRVR